MAKRSILGRAVSINIRVVVGDAEVIPIAGSLGERCSSFGLTNTTEFTLHKFLMAGSSRKLESLSGGLTSAVKWLSEVVTTAMEVRK